MVQERVVYLNGEMIPDSQAKVSIHDLGFLMGDAVFDTTRTFGRQIFKLDDHLDRFYQSLKYMRLDPGLTKGDMAQLTMQVLEANLPMLQDDSDYWVTQRVTRGERVYGGVGAGDLKPTVLIECQPLPFAARAPYYRDGLPVVVPSVRRTPPASMSPRAKVHNYINLLQGELEVKAQNPDAWAILLDINGNIAEGMGSNFFIVKDGVVITPKGQYVLGGISRETVLQLAAELRIEATEADIDLFDAYTADEAFVTSTSFCICPVVSVNGSTIGEGQIPAPVTGRLLQAYSELVGLDIVAQYLSHL
ncbi:MAG: aminotransferase class IV [bacterium]|nr:aminotransferase class IV [bacterium]